MDSRVVQCHVHEYDEHQPHDIGSQQVEERHHEHEKKSVLNKVKAKAKKIKDAIKKHGHHDHGHDEYHYEDQHIPDDHELNEEDNEDEEMIEDPEVHETPIYESPAVKSATPGQAENIRSLGVNFGGTTVTGEEPRHEAGVEVASPTIEIDQNRAIEPAKTFFEEEKSGKYKVSVEGPTALEEGPHAPGSKPEAYTPPNYQTKVTDPTGAGTADIDITQVEKCFERMNLHIHNVPKSETQYPSAESHDDPYLPELSSATKNQYPSAVVSLDQFAHETIPKSTNRYEEQPHHESRENSSNQNSYTDTISSATSAIADNAGSTSVGIETGSGVNQEEDKGVSVEEYLAEKLRPGEEDKALSEVISEALLQHKRIKEEPTKAASGDDNSQKMCEERYVKSTGKGVVDKFKGVVGSWFGKAGESQPSQVAGGEDLSENKDSGSEVEQVSQAAGERRLEE